MGELFCSLCVYGCMGVIFVLGIYQIILMLPGLWEDIKDVYKKDRTK
jgi:hypothetical protein